MPICITQLISHGRDWLHTAPTLPLWWPMRPRWLFLRTLNLRDGRGSGLAQAIRAVYIGVFDLMILMETNITSQYYCSNRLGYSVVWLTRIMKMDVSVHGGVGLVVQDQYQGLIIESTRFHGPNVLIWEVINDGKRAAIIGTYLPHSTLEHLPDFEEALTHFQDQDPILLGDINANIDQSQNPHSQQISDLLMEFRIMDLLHQLWKLWRFGHMKTWYQLRQGRNMRARCDYILRTDRSRFKNGGNKWRKKLPLISLRPEC